MNYLKKIMLEGIGGIKTYKIIAEMVKTWKQKYEDKYGKDKTGDVATISKTTGISRSILQEIFNRAIGAWRNNLKSVRLKSTGEKNVDAPRSAKMGKERWAYARVYAFVGGNAKQVGKGKPDSD